MEGEVAKPPIKRECSHEAALAENPGLSELSQKPRELELPQTSLEKKCAQEVKKGWFGAILFLRKRQNEGAYTQPMIKELKEKLTDFDKRQVPQDGQERQRVEQNLQRTEKTMAALQIISDWELAGTLDESTPDSQGRTGHVDKRTGEYWLKDPNNPDEKRREIRGRIQDAYKGVIDELNAIANNPKKKEKIATRQARSLYGILNRAYDPADGNLSVEREQVPIETRLRKCLQDRLQEYAQDEGQSPMACILTIYALIPPEGLRLKGDELATFRELVLQNNLSQAKRLLDNFLKRQLAAMIGGFSGSERKRAKEIYAAFEVLGGLDFPLEAVLQAIEEPNKLSEILANTPGITPDQAIIISDLFLNLSREDSFKSILPQNVAALSSEILPQLTPEQAERARDIFTLLKKAKNLSGKIQRIEAWKRVRERCGGLLKMTGWIALILAMFGIQAMFSEGMGGRGQAAGGHAAL